MKVNSFKILSLLARFFKTVDRYCIHVGGFCIIPVCLVIVAAHEFILFVKAFDRYSTSPSINSDAGHSERVKPRN